MGTLQGWGRIWQAEGADEAPGISHQQKAAVLVVVVLSWRAGTDDSCPGAMGRGEEEQRQRGGEGGCRCFFGTCRD